MAVLQEYKCPCCGGAIAFDSALQKMKCPYCDTEFEMDTLASYDSELKNELLKSYISDEYDVVETSEEEKVILPKNGYLYRTHRIYYQNGREVKREILRTSYYPPKKGIKYVKNNADNLDKNIDNGTQ